jgi:hypothetical protein
MPVIANAKIFMTQRARTLFGFFVAPAIPGVLLLIFNIFMGYGDGAIVGPILLAPLAYIAAAVIGIPVYLLLERKGIRSLRAYIAFGALIGPTFFLLYTILTAYPGTIPAVLERAYGAVLMATGYATAAAASFWAIAIRGRVPD